MQRLAEGRAQLAAYQRALWNHAPLLWALDETNEAQSPMLSNLGLHLPYAAPTEAQHWYPAATAHAGAHLVYSRERFDAASLKPITRALVGLLEDARVEWLACRELPGLRSLWLPFHAPTEGDDFEALMQRLARCLLDPTHDDAHPWVHKGRALFYGDADGRTLRLRRADDVRQAASRLGHDIGQMRLPFNPRLYVVQPSYRDDNACLWADTSKAQPQDQPLPEPGPGSSTKDADPAPVTVTLHRYPEWDRLIARHRLMWCTVHEQAPAVAVGAAAARGPSTGPWLPDDTVFTERLRRQADGDALDLDAALQSRLAQRLGQPPDERVHEVARRRPVPMAELCLLDLSASSTEAQLDHARRAVQWAAQAARRSGGVCAIDGFHSNGRHALHYTLFKRFDEPLDATVMHRLNTLRAGGSTRLGAAIRHATQRLLRRPEAHRRLLVLTDGEAHDIDVHDPRYLLEDARQAVAEARRKGIRVLGLGPTGAPLRPVFGPGAVAIS